MDKVKIGSNAFVYPMPMVLVGSVVEGRPNFMPVAWVTRVNNKPPLIAVAMGKSHYTNVGIHDHQQFSINVPGRDMVEAVDYCGLVSGKKEDKSCLFDIFTGDLEYAPMIAQCPVAMECKVVETVDLPSNTLFIGEIVAAYTEEKYLSDGKPDVQKVQPFTLTMPDNNYWLVGDYVGKAWGIGKSLIRT